MGLRLVLGITLLSLFVVLAARAYGGQAWEVSGKTDEGSAIWFGIGPDGRPDAFEVDVLTDCGGLRTWWQGDMVTPFVGQGDRLRAAQTVTRQERYGAQSVGRWRIEAVVGDDTISGRVRVDERWTMGGRETDACTSGTVTFTLPRD